MLAHKRNGTGEVTFEIWSKTAHLGCVSFSSYMQKLKSSLRVQDRAASSIWGAIEQMEYFVLDSTVLHHLIELTLKLKDKTITESQKKLRIEYLNNLD